MEPQARSQKPVYLALFLHVAISSATYLAAKRATMEIPAFTLTLVRLALSGLLLTAVLLATPGRKLPPRALWPKLIFLGVLCGPVNQGFFLAGLAASRPAHAALLYALTPVGIYLYMMSQKHEQLSARRLVGILVAFTGVLVLLLGRGLADATGPLFGDLLILVAVIAWVVYSAEGRRLVAEHGPIRLTAWTMIAGSICVLPLFPWLGDLSAVVRASIVAWLCLAFIVVFTSVIAYLLWYYALSRMTASKAAVFSNLQPVATALLAWAVLGDAINWEIAVGGLLVLAGVRVTQTG
ncbi:MAG: DMT family transporter [Myxococcaceae bacterium]